MENQDANRMALRSLQQALRAGRVIGLVGAGSSVRAGYPTWSGLLRQLEEAIQRNEPLLAGIVAQLQKEEDVLWRAQEYRRLLGEGYGSLLREVFGADGQLSEFHNKLVKLPLRHILTTNYDPILERAHTEAWGEAARWIHWDDSWDLREFIFRCGDPTYTRRYVYLHGRFNKPDSIILTEQDYRNRYVLSDRDGDRIAALLATQQVLSIGFSLSDFDVMELFRQVKARTGPGRPHHYALLPVGNDQDPGLYRRRLNGKFGVEPVFYPWSKDHAGLDELLDELSDRYEVQETERRFHRVALTISGTGPPRKKRAAPPPSAEPAPKEGFSAPSGGESHPEPAPPAARKAGRPRIRRSIFVSYSVKDASSFQKLKKHCNRYFKDAAVRLGWTDRPIQTGTEWDQELFDRLEKADLILLLVSPSLLASDYIYHSELKRALERQENGHSQVIPVILQPAAWKSAPFANLSALPRQGKPIAEWKHEDEAWQEVAAGLGRALAERL